jgi:Mrp family chromosome partitioning ATPase
VNDSANSDAGQTAAAPPPHQAAQEAPVEPQQTSGVRVIAFANQKGGVAKTTTTLNLAVAFAEAGNRVLAVDMDPQGNLTMSQGIDPDSVEKSMYDVLVHHISIREVIRKREVDVACASIDLAGAEIAMSTQIGRERSLEKALKPVLEDYDFVCIDTPPDDQRPDGRRQGYRAGSVRISVDARPDPASEHALDDPRGAQSRRGDRGHPSDAG